jgi:hypothetical protein
MNKYKCNICLTEFTSNYGLQKHITKKNKCDKKTNFQCKKCLRYFKYKKNLIEHNDKNNCSIKNVEFDNSSDNSYDEGFIDSPPEIEYEKENEKKNSEWLKKILSSSIQNDIKIQLICDFNQLLNIEKVTAILNSDLSLSDKIETFITLKKPNNNEITVNNFNNGTINNTTNNIQLNNFGYEKIDHLDNEYFKDLIMNNHIQEAYMKLIEDTYLNKAHPENNTIKITNLQSKYGFVYENQKWRPIVKYELKELMHEKNNKLLKIHYKRLREFLDAAKKSSINVFFSRQFNHDPQLKFMNDQMVLLFYKGKNKNII